MKIETLTLGAYQTNCYLVREESRNDILIIDPGYEPQAILNHITEQGYTAAAILLTHGHFDHVGGVKDLVAEIDCPVYLCPEELAMPESVTAGRLYYTDPYYDGDTFTLAGLPFRVLQTPGHTPGSVCLLFDGVMFCGDTLFDGSCGRTDMPCGSWEQMHASLQKLNALKEDYVLYPGHGGISRLSLQKKTNPYLRGLL